MIVIIDNYDSFTYNLYQYIGELEPDIRVFRNDRITVEEIKALKPTHIVISPGPGFPSDAGISVSLVRELGGTIPILGVCLGHQAIGEAFGGKIVHAEKLMHGKTSDVTVDTDCELFYTLPGNIRVGRYHSLVVEKKTLPAQLKITARTEDGVIMALQHKEYPVFGIQFHPESILTPSGKKILENFLAVRA